MGPVFTEHNDKKRFLLTIVDVLSRFAFVRPLQRKAPAGVVAAFESVVRVSQYPDESVAQKHDIRHYSTHSDKKAAMV